MSFLREYASTAVADRPALTIRWLGERPRELFAELRRDQPIFVTPNFVLVTRYADVFEVLSRDDVFHAGDRDDLLSPFDAALVRTCVRPSDAELIAGAAQGAALQALAQARARGGLDLVADLGQRVASRVANAYLGIGGPDDSTLARWLDTIRIDYDAFRGHDTGTRHDALSAAAELGGYTFAMIASRRMRTAAGEARLDDLLGRLTGMQAVDHLQLHDRRIHALLIGLIIALVEPLAAAIVHAMLALCERPAAAAIARSAAQAGDDPALWSALREALRLFPPRPALTRHCAQPYTLAQGTESEHVIRPGTVVLAAIGAAGLDPERVEAAEEFRPGRPTHHDFLFGHGAHACIGRNLAPAAIREACRPLLLAGELELAGPPRREGARIVRAQLVLPSS